MKLKTLALATAASLTVAASANAMDQEFNMLTGAVFNALVQLDVPTDGIQDLTLGQIATIKAILDSDDADNVKKQRVSNIIGG